MSSSERTNRLPQLKRLDPTQRPAFHLTVRDAAIIRAVYEYRTLTSRQIDQVFFNAPGREPDRPTGSRCLNRLKLLYHHEYLDRIEQQQVPSKGREPFLYVLDTYGATLVAGMLGCSVAELDWKRRRNIDNPRTLSHLLATNNVRVLFVQDASAARMTIGIWRDEHALRKLHIKDSVPIPTQRGVSAAGALIPDGYFTLESDDSRYHLFLEIDLRTEAGEFSTPSRGDWAHKVRAYMAYADHGVMTERYNAKSFRVLIITTSATRAANLKAITERAGGDLRFYFTTFAMVRDASCISGPIWMVATRQGFRSLVRT